VGQVTGVGKARENVFVTEPGITPQNLVFGLAGGEQFQNELNGKPSPSNHGFASQNVLVNNNSTR
jgi:hypothetical protein